MSWLRRWSTVQLARFTHVAVGPGVAVRIGIGVADGVGGGVCAGGRVAAGVGCGVAVGSGVGTGSTTGDAVGEGVSQGVADGSRETMTVGVGERVGRAACFPAPLKSKVTTSAIRTTSASARVMSHRGYGENRWRTASLAGTTERRLDSFTGESSCYPSASALFGSSGQTPDDRERRWIRRPPIV